jgi:hypothetical protein
MPSKEYHREKSKQWYQDNKEKQRLYSKEARLKKRKWFDDIMDEKSCTNCGNNDNRVLEWHHRDPSTKSFEVGTAFTKVGRAKLLAEMEKCIVLCANCHRIHHWENGWK